MLQSATQITDEEKGIGSVCFDITLHFHFLFFTFILVAIFFKN